MSWELTKYAKVNFFLGSLNDRCDSNSAKNKTLKQKNCPCSSPFCRLGTLEDGKYCREVDFWQPKIVFCYLQVLLWVSENQAIYRAAVYYGFTVTLSTGTFFSPFYNVLSAGRCFAPVITQCYGCMCWHRPPKMKWTWCLARDLLTFPGFCTSYRPWWRAQTWIRTAR